MPSYQVTLSEGGSPNCAGVYTEHILYNGQMSYRCVNDAGTWYLSWQGVSWYISQHLPTTPVDAYWLSSLPDITGDYAAGQYATGTATVAEYVPPADDTPDDFSFPAVVDADPETQYVSDPAEVTGMDAGTAISVENGEYRLNGGEWTSEPGTIDPEDTLELRATSSGEPKGVVAVSVTVGTLTKEWTVETRQARRFRFVCEGFVF